MNSFSRFVAGIGVVVMSVATTTAVLSATRHTGWVRVAADVVEIHHHRGWLLGTATCLSYLDFEAGDEQPLGCSGTLVQVENDEALFEGAAVTAWYNPDLKSQATLTSPAERWGIAVVLGIATALLVFVAYPSVSNDLGRLEASDQSESDDRGGVPGGMTRAET